MPRRDSLADRQPDRHTRTAATVKGPVIRLCDQAPEKANDNGQKQPRRSAIVEPKREPNAMLDDITPEELKRRGDAADALFRKIAGRGTRSENA